MSLREFILKINDPNDMLTEPQNPGKIVIQYKISNNKNELRVALEKNGKIEGVGFSDELLSQINNNEDINLLEDEIKDIVADYHYSPDFLKNIDDIILRIIFFESKFYYYLTINLSTLNLVKMGHGIGLIADLDEAQRKGKI